MQLTFAAWTSNTNALFCLMQEMSSTPQYEAGRGGNKIPSALVDFYSFMKRNPCIIKVRLSTDSCPAQNKNYALLLVLPALARELNISFEVNYPVFSFLQSGFSFLPTGYLAAWTKYCEEHDTILTPETHFALLHDAAVVGIQTRDRFVHCLGAAKRYLRTDFKFKIIRLGKLHQTSTAHKMNCRKTKVYRWGGDCHVLSHRCQHELLHSFPDPNGVH